MRTILEQIILGIFLLIVGSGITSAQQLNMGDILPQDTSVRVGKLDNGMRYYLRHNAKSTGLADFYIVYDVGSVQEEDSQNGLAHFLEHMMFNGTKHFPGDSTWAQDGTAIFRHRNHRRFHTDSTDSPVQNERDFSIEILVYVRCCGARRFPGAICAGGCDRMTRDLDQAMCDRMGGTADCHSIQSAGNGIRDHRAFG